MHATKPVMPDTTKSPDLYTEEYAQLWQLIEAGDKAGARKLLCELDEMNKRAAIRAIKNRAHRLLQHLIKRYHRAKYAPARNMNDSWIATINESVRQFRDRNEDWHYIQLTELRTILESLYKAGLGAAADEMGVTDRELGQLIEQKPIIDEAYDLISTGRRIDKTVAPYGL